MLVFNRDVCEFADVAYPEDKEKGSSSHSCRSSFYRKRLYCTINGSVCCCSKRSKYQVEGITEKLSPPVWERVRQADEVHWLLTFIPFAGRVDRI